MGCIRKIFQILILALALVGFMSIGGKDFIVQQYENYFGNSKESTMDRASKLGDFSALSDEFEIDKAASAFGYKGVLAEHNASGQKMLIIDSGKKPILTEDDFENDRVDEKINALIRKFKYQSLQVDDFTITKKGTMHAYGEKVHKLPLGTVGGIISAIDISPEESRMLISLNENKKYSQLITNEFFSKVKLTNK